MWACAADLRPLMAKANAGGLTLVQLDAARVPPPQLPFFEPRGGAASLVEVRGVLRAAGRGHKP